VRRLAVPLVLALLAACSNEAPQQEAEATDIPDELAGAAPTVIAATGIGTPMAERDRLVTEFQTDAAGPPVFVLSLKAGGTGLNLTRANHVFHFDRWWNPAVENQATDRAFRIGQTRSVQVHKFICGGTFEEKIDAMIEGKLELATKVVGTRPTISRYSRCSTRSRSSMAADCPLGRRTVPMTR